MNMAITFEIIPLYPLVETAHPAAKSVPIYELCMVNLSSLAYSQSAHALYTFAYIRH